MSEEFALQQPGGDGGAVQLHESVRTPCAAIVDGRQLRDLRLVEASRRNISDVQTGRIVDLSDYVKLTEFGTRWFEH